MTEHSPGIASLVDAAFGKLTEEYRSHLLDEIALACY